MFRRDEREWRSWVDSKFVHVISPNCYRTMGEAITTFKWFEKAGEWEKEFNSFERMCMIYVGAFVMYLIAGKLKKKYIVQQMVYLSVKIIEY
jgi:microsomal prostaglandin-E synthase 2